MGPRHRTLFLDPFHPLLNQGVGLCGPIGIGWIPDDGFLTKKGELFCGCAHGIDPFHPSIGIFCRL